MELERLWGRFTPVEQGGIKLAGGAFAAFVAGCTLWGGLAAHDWAAAANIFVNAVGAFGQVSIAAGLYLLTRDQLHEARNASRAEAEREARAEVREATREREAEHEAVSRDVNLLDNVCGCIVLASRERQPVDPDWRRDLSDLTSRLAAKPRFRALEGELRKLREIGQRVGGPAASPKDQATFGSVRRSLIAILRQPSPRDVPAPADEPG